MVSGRLGGMGERRPKRSKGPPARPGGPQAVVYLRVSTGPQELGLEAQDAAVRASAERMGLPIASIHVDQGVSGAAGLEERVGLQAALAELRSRDVLLVAKRDRLARNVTELAFIERAIESKGARIVSAAGEGSAEEDTPADQLMRRMIDAFAEFELSMIRARTKAALAAKKCRGERVGNVPYGKQLDAGGQLVDCLEELEVIRAVAGEVVEGGTHRELVRRLRVRGIVSPRSGKPLALWQVQKILRRLNKEA